MHSLSLRDISRILLRAPAQRGAFRPDASAGSPRTCIESPTMRRDEVAYIPGIGMISTISIQPPGIICRWGWLLPKSFAAASWDCAWTIE
jgi:hypothetical protein